MAVWDARPSYTDTRKGARPWSSASMIGVVWRIVNFIDPIMIGSVYGYCKVGIQTEFRAECH